MKEVLRFLAARAIPGLEEAGGGFYRRSLELERGAAVLDVREGGAVDARQGGAVAPDERAPAAALDEGARLDVRLADERDRPEAVARMRRLLDLDADTARIDAALGRDPLLGPLVRRRPGLRVPRATDGFELAVRAVIGQQVTLAGARRTGARLVALCGRPLDEPAGSITHLFPAPHALAQVDAAELGMPRVRANALRALARAVLDGELDLRPTADRAATTGALLALPGIGPWTAAYVAMRALGDSDAFPPGDAAVRATLKRLGEDARPAAAQRLAERWRPWRSYALMHLWRADSHDGQPGGGPGRGGLRWSTMG
jgi:AraC family transcriptional regulator of adaptative response / DNA-3-methyladenine glycosylase II